MNAFTPQQLSKLDSKNQELIQSAKGFLSGKRQVVKDLGPTAVRNLLDVAQSATCIEEIHAFVEYQIGKEKRKWNADQFGAALLKALDKSGPIEKAASAVSIDGLDEEGKMRLRVVLAVRWLGYLYRYFRYLKEEGGK